MSFARIPNPLLALARSRAQYALPRMTRALVVQRQFAGLGFGGLGFAGGLGNTPLVTGADWDNDDAANDFIGGIQLRGSAGWWPGYNANKIASVASGLATLSGITDTWALKLVTTFTSELQAAVTQVGALQRFGSGGRSEGRDLQYKAAMQHLADLLDGFGARMSAASYAASAAEAAEEKRLAAIEATKQRAADAAQAKIDAAETARQKAATAAVNAQAAAEAAAAKASIDAIKARSDAEAAAAKAGLEAAQAQAQAELQAKTQAQSQVDSAAAKLVALTQSGASPAEIEAAKAAVRTAMAIQEGSLFDASTWTPTRIALVAGAAVGGLVLLNYLMKK